MTLIVVRNHYFFHLCGFPLILPIMNLPVFDIFTLAVFSNLPVRLPFWI